MRRRARRRWSAPGWLTAALMVIAAGGGTAAGEPGDVPPVIGAAQLDGWRHGVAEADAGEDPLVIVALGDSNTEAATWTVGLRDLLQGGYGNRGVGYHSLGPRQPIPRAPVIERSGSWQMFDTSPGRDAPPEGPWFALDGFWTRTEDPQATVTISADHLQRFVLHYQVGPGLGSFTVYNGDWAQLEVDCEAPEPGYATSPPLLGERFAVRDVSGRVVLFGFDAQRIDFARGRPVLRGGAVVHALGNAWGQAAHVSPIESAAFGAFFDATEPDLVIVLFGTNDMHNDGRIDRYRQTMTELVAKVRSAAPHAGVLVISCPEAGQTRSGAAEQYASAARQVASEQGAAFWDLRQIVGPRSRHWIEQGFFQDGLHYSELGGRLWTRLLLRQLGFDLGDLDHYPILRQESATPSPATVSAERMAGPVTVEDIKARLADARAWPIHHLDRAVADVRLAITDDAVLVKATVRDGQCRPGLASWSGGAFDLYFAPEPGAAVRQFVFHPGGPDGRGRWTAHRNGADADLPEFQWRMTPIEPFGYELSVRLPFAAAGLERSAATFLFESAANTAPGPGAPSAYRRLFLPPSEPNRGAFRHTTWFARVTVEAD